MEGQELTIRQNEDIILTPPDVVLENARIAAKALADVISHKKHPVIMNGEQYLEYEDLQTLGQFYGYSVRTGDSGPVEIDSIKGAKAHADLIQIKTGEIIGGAESYCMRDEDNWKNKPWFQLASMAQTRAGAKALRNRLAWVVVLAGYKPTPAEEMTGTEHQTMPVGHLCPIHHVLFFKKGKMTGYAHKLDNGEWCNEDAEAPQPPSSTSEKQATPSPKEESKPPVDLGIDMDWLRESLDKLQWTTAGKWLKEKYPKATGAKVSEIVKGLTLEQRKEFAQEVNRRLSEIR